MLKVKFSIVRGSHDNLPVPYEMPWEQLARRLTQHDEGLKDGTALIPCTFTATRAKETVDWRYMIALDVEARTLHLEVSDAELAERKKSWKAPTLPVPGGYQQLYVDHVSQADAGADFDFLVGCRGSNVARESH